ESVERDRVGNGCNRRDGPVLGVRRDIWNLRPTALDAVERDEFGRRLTPLDDTGTIGTAAHHLGDDFVGHGTLAEPETYFRLIDLGFATRLVVDVEQNVTILARCDPLGGAGAMLFVAAAGHVANQFRIARVFEDRRPFRPDFVLVER